MTQALAQTAAPIETSKGAILVTGGHLLDPVARVDGKADLLIENGRVSRIGEGLDPGRADQVIDASGLMVFPGFLDLHAYLREPGATGSENIETGTRAAAAGGYTTVCAMPSTSPVCDSPVVVRYMIDRAERSGCVEVLPIAAVTRGQEGKQLADMAALREAGAPAVGDALHAVSDAQVLRRALQYARELGLPIFVHPEDPDLSSDGLMQDGEIALKLGLRGIPRSAEASIVARDAALALETGARLHFAHISNKDSVEILRFYKALGAPITAGVTPHHLVLTDEAVAGSIGRRFDTSAKVKPPLGDESDREALIGAVEDGTIDCISTDHAPHFPASKDTTFDVAPFGAIGFESAFPALYTAMVDSGRWTLERLVHAMTEAPNRVLRRPQRSLEEGAEASLTLFEVGRLSTFGENRLRSRSRNCPWLGSEVSATCCATLWRGTPAFASPAFFPNGVFRARS